MMDVDECTMEEKCENLMNVVVESRKRFGKMCIDYDQKTSLMENKILYLQLETISNYRFKSKNALPSQEVEEMCKTEEYVNNFTTEILERRKKVEDLKKRVKDAQALVLQLKRDNIGRKVHQPLTAEAMLMQAKEKQSQIEKSSDVL